MGNQDGENLLQPRLVARLAVKQEFGPREQRRIVKVVDVDRIPRTPVAQGVEIVERAANGIHIGRIAAEHAHETGIPDPDAVPFATLSDVRREGQGFRFIDMFPRLLPREIIKVDESGVGVINEFRHEFPAERTAVFGVMHGFLHDNNPYSSRVSRIEGLPGGSG